MRKLLNKLLNRPEKTLCDKFVVEGEVIRNEYVVANKFNEFFTKNPRSIRDSIPDSFHDYLNLIPRNYETMSFFYTTQDEVEGALNSLKKNGGIDSLPVKFLKMCGAHLTLLLSNFFNQCIDSDK